MGVLDRGTVPVLPRPDSAFSALSSSAIDSDRPDSLLLPWQPGSLPGSPPGCSGELVLQPMQLWKGPPFRCQQSKMEADAREKKMAGPAERCKLLKLELDVASIQREQLQADNQRLQQLVDQMSAALEAAGLPVPPAAAASPTPDTRASHESGLLRGSSGQQHRSVFWTGPTAAPADDCADETCRGECPSSGGVRRVSSGVQGTRSASDLRKMFIELRTLPEGEQESAEGEDLNGHVTIQTFISALSEMQLDLSKHEMHRLFDKIDPAHTGLLSYRLFCRAWRRNRFLQTIVSDYAHPHSFSVPDSYDYGVETYRTQCHPDYKVAPGNQWGTSSSKQYDPAMHGPLVGNYVHVRERVDYKYHTNYSNERQRWQDKVVADVAVRMYSQERPWLVYTCGAMGAGKGHAMSWLSQHGLFELENVVHIDPDHFKSVMPEWRGYIEADKTNGTQQAGTMCHKESGFLQELATEIALTRGQNTWIDGSLGDSDWFRQEFAKIRERFPQYRIAIFYVYCAEETVLSRAYNRGLQTGRFVPEETLRTSMQNTRKSVDVLGPLADFLVKINNEHRTPVLEVFEDRSHSFVPIRERFSPIQSSSDFPLAHPVLRILANAVRPCSLCLRHEHRRAICDSEGGKKLHYVAAEDVYTRETIMAFLDQFTHGQQVAQVDSAQTVAVMLRKQVETQINDLDDNQDGRVDLDEFIAAGGTAEQFRRYDVDRDGLLDVTEMMQKASCEAIEQELPWKSVCFSAAEPINLDVHSRRVAGIPLTAEYVSFCDGAMDANRRRLGMQGCKWVSEGKQELDNILRLMLRGGFVYFDKEFTIVGINVIVWHFQGGHVIQFGDRQDWDANAPLVRQLVDAGRLVTLEERKSYQSHGIVKRAWIHPNEIAEAPFGGFFYYTGGSSPNHLFPIITSD